MTRDQILLWLSHISTGAECDRPTPVDKKRKRQHRESRFPSPPPSPMDPETEAAHHRKRTRTLEGEASRYSQETPGDIEQRLATAASPFTIPRPPPSAPAATEPDRGSTAQTSTTGGSSKGGRTRSTARKRLRSLALQDDGIMTRSMIGPLTDMPEELQALMREIEDCGHGLGVISNKRRLEIEDTLKLQDSAKMSHSRSTYRVLNHAMWYPADDGQQQRREAWGPTPYVQDVLPVLDWAARCTSQAAEEAMWNTMVHGPLLQLAVYGGRGIPERQDDNDAVAVELAQCTTARLIKEYLPTQETSGKQVDFCLYLDVDSTAQQRIDLIRASLPLASINHFDLDGLINRPVALSCESKKLDSHGGASEAKLQIGVWHAAQWKLLKHLVARQESQDLLIVSDLDAVGTAHRPALPAFLPAVIIAGHEWSFVATTQKQDKTVLWTEYPFGHTRDASGVYKTICGLQILSAWAREKYWPWIRRYVLGLTGSDI